jgi:phosphatidylinositol glycan class M
MLLGLATHWRVYPVIYLLPVLRFLHLARASAGARHQRGEPADRHGQAAKQACSSAAEPIRHVQSCMSAIWTTRSMVKFASAFAAVFAGLAALCYAAYGDSFLEQAYLYHGRRVDPRHNFSPARLELL